MHVINNIHIISDIPHVPNTQVFLRFPENPYYQISRLYVISFISEYLHGPYYLCSYPRYQNYNYYHCHLFVSLISLISKNMRSNDKTPNIPDIINIPDTPNIRIMFNILNVRVTLILR